MPNLEIIEGTARAVQLQETLPCCQLGSAGETSPETSRKQTRDNYGNEHSEAGSSRLDVYLATDRTPNFGSCLISIDFQVLHQNDPKCKL